MTEENREAQLEEIIQSWKHSEGLRAMEELLALRREGYRDKIEKNESERVRGRSLECKDLLQLFS